MAYKQPRVPPMKDGTRIAEYIRELILFLKDFCLETWRAVTQIQRDTAGDRVTSINGKSGEVTLGASDVGALPSDGTAADSAKLNGKAPEYYIQPRNLLDNSDFTNPVNQRSVGSWSNAYGLDRWLAWESTAYVTTDGIKIADSTGYPNLQQRFSKGVLNADKLYTVAIYDVDGNITFGTIGYEESFDYCTIPASVDKTYTRAVLYEGSYTADNLPPYVPKGYAAEMAECQMYCRLIGAANINSNVHVGYAQAATTTVSNGVVTVGNMRLVSVSYKQVGDLVLRKGTTDIATTLTGMYVHNGVAYLQFSASGLVAGDMYAIRFVNGGHLILSADL